VTISIYSERIQWGDQSAIVSMVGGWESQTIGWTTLRMWDVSERTTTKPDSLPVATPVGNCPRYLHGILLGSWLDLWVSRRFAGGAVPLTSDPTPAINKDIAMLTLPARNVPSSVIDAAAIHRMVDEIGRWTGASRATLTAIAGVKSTKTLYNWRDRPGTVLRPATRTRLVRIHALVRSIILHMGPLDGRAWLVSGHPSPLDLLARGEDATVERRAQDAGVRIGAMRRVLSPGERETLHRGGLRLEPMSPATREDVAARTRALSERLLAAGHNVAETARLLDRSVEDVRRLLRKKEIYGVQRDGDWIIPGFQFEDDRLILGVTAVMRHIPDDAHIIEVYTWFTSPSPDLEDEDGKLLSPRDWLILGRAVAPVVAQAIDL